ncbi:hypothetical protein CsSME_00015453 [Camellia sinensis var. sinensis]
MTEDPPMVTDDTTQRYDLTPTNMHGSEIIPARRALHCASPSTPEHEATQAIVEKAKQNEQRLANMIAENERLRQDLASEVEKSKRVVRQAPEQLVKADGRRSRAR